MAVLEVAQLKAEENRKSRKLMQMVELRMGEGVDGYA